MNGTFSQAQNKRQPLFDATTPSSVTWRQREKETHSKDADGSLDFTSRRKTRASAQHTAAGAGEAPPYQAP